MLELGPGAASTAGEWSMPGRSTRPCTSLTGQYLTGEKRIARAERAPARAGPRWLRLRGATLHNLQGVDVRHPAGRAHRGDRRVRLRQEHAGPRRALPRSSRPGCTASTRPSRTWASRWARSRRSPAGSSSRTWCWSTSRRSAARPRSNPVTYIKAFDEIRELFAAQPLARQREVHRRRLLVQRRGRPLRGVRGRGPRPGGDGVPGRRLRALRGLRRHALQAARCSTCRSRASSIHDVLQWTVDEAMTRFRHQPKLGRRALAAAAGRARLPPAGPAGHHALRRRGAAAEDRARAGAGGQEGGRKLYILDEPTTGLAPRRRAGADAACSTGWSTPGTRWSSSSTTWT